MRGIALAVMMAVITTTVPTTRVAHAGAPRAISVRVPLGAATPSLTTAPLKLGRAYDRLVPWWNARTAAGGRVIVEARVERGGKPLGDWLRVATWARDARGPRDAGAGDVVLDQDTLRVKGGADAVALRVTVEPPARLTALGVTAFSSAEDARPTARAPGAELRLRVPYRSQRDADPKIAARVCGPTSLSMALDFRGVKLSTDAVAALARDPAGQIQYGNWAYLAATAAEQGVEAEVRAMPGLDDVVTELRNGNPVLLALSFGRGVLRGAPVPQTAGHLVLACGFDNDGNIYVNDPAGHGTADGQVKYDRRELARAWKRGIGIVIRKPATRE